MVVNTLIKTIESERVRCMGYSYCDALLPRHWFQFADDSALVTFTEEDSQSLLNVFTKWCNWATLVIRVDKCKTFGIMKCGSKSVQFQPYLRVNSHQIPTVENNRSFDYL